jgi:hypothetical protein
MSPVPKFEMLKPGTDPALIRHARERVERCLAKFFDPAEIVRVEDLWSFPFGTVRVQIAVLPWHRRDTLVRVFAYLAQEVTLTPELSEKLLQLNAQTPLGAFAATFDGSVLYSYTLAGTNLDPNEFLAAVQTVAVMADQYDELVKEA